MYIYIYIYIVTLLSNTSKFIFDNFIRLTENLKIYNYMKLKITA